LSGKLRSPCLSRDGHLLTLFDESRGQGIIFDLENKTERARLDYHRNQHQIALSPDGRWVASAALRTHGAGITKVWDARTGKLVKDLPTQVVTGDSYVAFTSDGRWLVTTTREECRFWKTESWEPAHVIGREHSVWPPGGLAFSRDGRMLAIMHSFASVQLLDPSTRQEIASLVAPDTQRIYHLRFSADGSCLAASRDNQIVTVWDLRQIRKQLAAIGLDWDLPPYPPPQDGPSGPFQAEVDLGSIVDRQQADKFTKERNWAAAVVALNRLLELESANNAVRAWRGSTFAEMGEWEKAVADLATANDCWHLSSAHAGAGDWKRYRDLCKTLLDHFGEPGYLSDANLVAWICVRFADAVDDPLRPLRLAEKAAAANPNDWAIANTHGAALYRAGRYQAAIDALEKSIAIQGKGGTPEDWFFLAMAHHRLEQSAAPRKWLHRSIDWLDEPAPDNPKSGPRRLSLPWWTRVEYRILQAEAQGLIEGMTPDTAK
jgi:hypothetical protein